MNQFKRPVRTCPAFATRKPPTNSTRRSTGSGSIPSSLMCVLWYTFLKWRPARSRSTTQWLATLNCPYAVFASNVGYILKKQYNFHWVFISYFTFQEWTNQFQLCWRSSVITPSMVHVWRSGRTRHVPFAAMSREWIQMPYILSWYDVYIQPMFLAVNIKLITLHIIPNHIFVNELA